VSAFRILTVCTGNICRSPLAEQLLRDRIPPTAGVELSSAGTQALIGHAMDERAATYSRQFGGDPSIHCGRQLTVEHVREADLILAMSREHRRAIVELLPRASRFTFTLRELARLLAEAEVIEPEELPVDPDAAGSATTGHSSSRLTTVVENAAAARGMAPPNAPEDDDIVDPYRQSDEVYATSVEQLVPALESVVTAIQLAVAGGRD
jgi:Protein-tyrosine-phosphatase